MKELLSELFGLVVVDVSVDGRNEKVDCRFDLSKVKVARFGEVLRGGGA